MKLKIKTVNLVGGGLEPGDIITISNTEIIEGSDIDTPIYYYQPSPEDVEEEKLFFQDQNGKAVEVPFLSKQPQTISLSKNSVELDVLSPTDSVTVTADGEINANSTDTSVAIVSISNDVITINMVETGSCQINVVAGATKTKASASAIINVSTNTDIALSSEPEFNSNNFVQLDTTATRQYYFGQYGNAFYGVSDGIEEAITGTGQASGEVPYWELVDTDSSINGAQLSSIWGGQYDGGPLLNYTNGLKNTYFNIADQSVMKNAGANISTQSGQGDIIASSAFMWPLSYAQLSNNNNLAKKLFIESGNNAVWTRTFWSIYGQASKDWYIADKYGGISNQGMCSWVLRVAPAFNLDLAKVLIPKPALSDDTLSQVTDISVKVSEDIKFLINAGTAKSDFSISLTGEYSVTEITSVNSGINYISYIVYDSNGLSLIYGNAKELTETSGTIDFKADIIDDIVESTILDPGAYTLAIFQEEKCDAYKTDYASEPTYFAFTIS